MSFSEVAKIKFNTSASGNGAPLIEVRGVSFVYHGVEGAEDVYALRGVSFSVDSGEMMCVRGASGAGKSTLLRILGCLDRPSEGSYRFGQRDVGELDEDELAQLRLQGIGFVFQDFQLLDTATVGQNVELPATGLRIAPGERRRRTRELLREVGLEDKLACFPRELSGGEQQRVGVARALMGGAAAILADEPTGALDSAQADELLTLLEEVAASGHAVVVVSHDALVAERAHRVIDLADGQVAGGQPWTPQPSVKVRETSTHRRRSRWASCSPPFLLHGLRRGGIRTTLMAGATVVGIALVIVLLGVTQGAFGGATKAVGDMGASWITVAGSRFRVVGARENGQFEPVREVELTRTDAALIESRVGNVRSTHPQLARHLDVRVGDRILNDVFVVAQSDTVPRTVLDIPWPMALGRGLSASDSEEFRQVCVVGPYVAERMFGPGEGAIDAHIDVGGLPFRVKGVLGPNPVPTSIFLAGNRTPPSDEEIAEMEQQIGTIVFLPFGTAAETVFGTEILNSIVVEAEDPQLVHETATEIRNLIVATHGTEGVTVEVNATLADAYARMAGFGTTTLAGVGIVGLFGTGLIVMSAMLAAVDSRKQEIGLRLAFGARRVEILLQFTGEAVLISLLGGAIGAVAGFAVGPNVSSFLDLPFAIEPWFLAVALFCAVATGVLAGYFPASRAARVEPATWLGHVD